MAKRSRGKAAAHKLFDEPDPLAHRRRRRHLFLPRMLQREGASKQIRGEEFDRAKAIIGRWVALAVAGELTKHKETSLDANFINELFGAALRYSRNTEAPGRYDLEHKLSIPGGGIADAGIGNFPSQPPQVTAVIELKDAGTHLDRDRTQGRTPVQQLWDYLAALPTCPWGILSNFETIRLYHRDRTPGVYEEFTLAELSGEERFGEFYCLLERGGLLPSAASQTPRALRLLEQSESRQREVGDSLYSLYSDMRARLIDTLRRRHGYPLERAIHAAQRLIDRIVFVAFCEDRDLLPGRTIAQTHASVAPFAAVPNPVWRNFKELFRAIDKGHQRLRIPSGYNGGLFAFDAAVDELELEDDFAEFFVRFGEYDFRDEVNVDVLGHLFERSIHDLEQVRRLPLLEKAKDPAGEPEERSPSPMPKSAQRKLQGIYYTPAEFTALLVDRTIVTLAKERLAALATRHAVDPDDPASGGTDARLSYWHEAAHTLAAIRVCDPACGSGAFLIAAYDALEHLYQRVVDGLAEFGAAEAKALAENIPEFILGRNLFGVDLSPESVEITQLALWIRSARPGRTLSDLSNHIVCGNSLVADAHVHSRAIDWQLTFPEVFLAGGFDCVIGNPPWERIKLQEREFFAARDPAIAQAVSAADRRRMVAALPRRNPALLAAYETAKADADRLLAHVRDSGQFPLTCRGDVNTYMLFAELAQRIVAPHGLVGLLVPSGIATDETTRQFFGQLTDGGRLVALYDFENRRRLFPDVHASFKFSAIVFGGRDRRSEQADFIFFAHTVDDLADRRRHIALGPSDFKLFNPNTRTCPVFRSRRDAELTRAIYERVPVLVDGSRVRGGNPWEAAFLRMFDQTSDAELFLGDAELKAKGLNLAGNRWIGKPSKRGRKSEVFLPLYEAKMVQAFDHRAASVAVAAGNWVRQGQKAETTLAEHQNPEHVVMPRFWVAEERVHQSLDRDRPALLCFKDVTSPTNERTMIAAFIPVVGVVNSAPLLLTGDSVTPRRQCCLLANLNAVVLDFVARQKVGGVHLNYFIVEQLPILAPEAYDEPCPWDRRSTLEAWISERVLKLTCASEDMRPLADACGFKGSRGDGVHAWKQQQREELRAELDAAFFLLYGVERDDIEHVLDSFVTTRRIDAGGTAASDARRRLILEHVDGLSAHGMAAGPSLSTAR